MECCFSIIFAVLIGAESTEQVGKMFRPFSPLIWYHCLIILFVIMKKSNLVFRGLALIACMAVLASCNENSLVISEDVSEEYDAVVHVQTRSSSSGYIDYPLSLYAFDADGVLQDECTVESDVDACSLHLMEDVSCHIVAVSAPDDYTVPQQAARSSVIGMKSDGVATSSPLQMGFADIVPAAGNLTVQIQLEYQVASLEFSFSGMPESCSDVSVSVSSVSEGISMSGKYSGECSITVKCSRQGDIWLSEPVYVFPSVSDRTVFTVSYSDEDGSHACSVTYLSSLSAGVPYLFSGSFADGYLDVTGAVSFSQWGDTRVIDFSFGPDCSSEIADSEPVRKDDIYEVNAMPTSCSVWNGHIVAMVENVSPESAVITLLSLRNWRGMTSALNEKTPDMASDVAYAYAENGIVGWEIPSEEDAKEIKKLYNESSLASAIQTAAADTIVLKNEKGDNARYLSEQATRTFSFQSSGKTGAAGASNSDYYLRLIRKVNVVLKQ